MADAIKKGPRAGGKNTFASVVTLARWQLRQAWGLLLITGVGIVAAVVLVCAVPLYARVAMSAGLRGVLTTSPQNTDIIVRSSSTRISAPLIDKVSGDLTREFQKNLGPYLEPPQFSLEVSPMNVLFKKLSRVHQEMGLISAPIDQAAAHVHLLQGRLPQAQSKDIELAITPESADSLHVTVGSVLNVEMDMVDAYQVTTVQTLPLHIVGIFTLNSENDAFWHGNDFSIYEPSDFLVVHKGLVSNQTLLANFTHLSDQAAAKGRVYYTAVSVIWYYRLNLSRIAIDDLDTIINGVNTVKVDNGNNTELDQSPFLEQTVTYQVTDVLDTYRNRISVAQLPVVSLLVLMLALVLFFVSVMIDLLIDRQADAIAILHSRGASRGQVFSALMMQGVSLTVIALVAGPLLALPLVYVIAGRSLSAADQSVLALVPHTLGDVAVQLGGYALLAVVVAIAALALAILAATRRDMLSIRREAARSTRRALWLRLNLDIVAVIIALSGYGMSVYLTNSDVLDARLRLLLLSPLTLAESAFLLIAGILVFLRFFPDILRLGTWLAMRSRGAAPMLALAQMARSPRQSVRMTLLLALTTAFAVFTIIFIASQAQRIVDVTNYQGGADFSGGIPATIVTRDQMQQEIAGLQHISGVQSVSLGYSTPANAAGTLLAIPINFTAIDPSTFAQTVIWTPQDSSQPLSSLMAELAAQRSQAIASKEIPAVVDASAWDKLHLSPGATFTVNFATNSYGELIHFKAITKVQHIPTAGDTSVPGVMVDFLSYITVSTHGYATATSRALIVPLNYAWIRTKDDPVTIARVRNALSQGSLFLDPLYDRRALAETLYHEPLYLALVGVLTLGATTAIVLAVVGNLIASWLSARSRLTNFAVLRALGASPRQIASTLTWEQGIIYTTAIGLGVLFGAFFSTLVIPGLVFTSIAPQGASNSASSGAFYSIQSTPPIQIVIPNTLGIALGVLVAVCMIALFMMVRIVSQTSIGQMLRMNED